MSPVQPWKALLQRLVIPFSILMDVMDALEAYHGGRFSYEYSVISPVPEMVSSPAAVSFQVRLSPQLPLWSARAAPQASRAISAVRTGMIHSLRFMLLPPLFSPKTQNGAADHRAETGL